MITDGSAFVIFINWAPTGNGHNCRPRPSSWSISLTGYSTCLCQWKIKCSWCIESHGMDWDPACAYKCVNQLRSNKRWSNSSWQCEPIPVSRPLARVLKQDRWKVRLFLTKHSLPQRKGTGHRSLGLQDDNYPTFDPPVYHSIFSWLYHLYLVPVNYVKDMKILRSVSLTCLKRYSTGERFSKLLLRWSVAEDYILFFTGIRNKPTFSKAYQR